MSLAMQLLSPAGLAVSKDRLELVSCPTSNDCRAIVRSGRGALELLGAVSKDCRGIGRSGGGNRGEGSNGIGGASAGGGLYA